MEHLTKQQIVLLTLLVSFVSSIATGIVTVSLLDQAPPAVTQTINRVVERTIEKAVIASTSTPQVTKETIVIKDDEATVAAIAKASPAIVRVYARLGGSSDPDFVGLGAIVSSKGLVVAHVSVFDRSNWSAILEGGNSVALSLIAQDSASGLALFQAEQGTSAADIRAYAAATLGNSDGIKLGQSVIAIGGAREASALQGNVSSVVRDGPLRPSGVRGVNLIRTSISDADLTTHSVLVNLAGEVIGWKTGYSREDGYIPSLLARDYFNLNP